MNLERHKDKKYCLKITFHHDSKQELTKKKLSEFNILAKMKWSKNQEKWFLFNFIQFLNL